MASSSRSVAVDVTGADRSTVGVSQQASYTKTPPAPRRVLSGTTLTLSYGCPVELSCNISYTVQVPRAVAVRVAGGAGEVTLTSLSGPATAQTSTVRKSARSPYAISASSDVGSISISPS
jgi:hypothetical protein